MTGAKGTDPCRAAIEHFVSRRLAEMPALPVGCRLSVVEDVLIPLGTGDGGGNLGSEHRKRAARRVRVSGFEEPVRVWHDGTGVILLLEADGRDLGDRWAALRAGLGEPDARVDFDWKELEVKGGHWIYAARGLAFYLRYGDDGPVRFVAFPPAPVRAYLEELTLHLGTVERE